MTQTVTLLLKCAAKLKSKKKKTTNRITITQKIK